ncbi:MAG: type I-D CRISPR-associated protein Cas7/Csc2, partial [Thermoprotei archaeon]
VEGIEEWCVKREKPDWYNAVPKGKVANVYLIIEAQSRLIIRHEQETTDVTEIPTPYGFSVPAILNTKLQAVVRRTLLTMLHEWYDRNREVVKKEGLWDEEHDYGCTMRPYMRREKGARPEEAFTGYCGKCPNCLIFGYAVQEGEGYNVKSRVEGDLYVATAPRDKAVVEVTFNAVDDITKTTQMPGMETGALFTFNMVEAGTLFVGKLALKDVTMAELLLTLAALARTARIGGRQTHFGRIKIHIPAILFSTQELGGGYELALKILGKHKDGAGFEETLGELAEYVKGFGDQGILVLDREMGDKLRGLTQQELDSIILQAWRDARIFKESLDGYVRRPKRGK